MKQLIFTYLCSSIRRYDCDVAGIQSGSARSSILPDVPPSELVEGWRIETLGHPVLSCTLLVVVSRYRTCAR